MTEVSQFEDHIALIPQMASIRTSGDLTNNNIAVASARKSIKQRDKFQRRISVSTSNAPADKPSQNLRNRTLLTFVMIFLFIGSLYLPKAYLYAMIYIIKSFAFLEITRAQKFPTRHRLLPSKFLPLYFMVVADISLIGRNIARIYNNFFPVWMQSSQLFMIFTLYTAGLVIFVLHLDLAVIKTQFAQFAVSHIAIYFLTLSANVFITNIHNGKLWLVFPALLVVSNDIFAYIFGKLYGKTPLIKLSPKKTREGFIGGLISTILIGFLMAHFKVRFGIFADKLDAQIFAIKKFCIGKYCLSVPKIYLHTLSFVLFGGLIAPFGGFFASGFKRAFRIKDFGKCIPGHGGLADRMDCQFLMGIFTYVYYRTFIMPRVYTAETFFQAICKNLPHDELDRLIRMLLPLARNET